jgi:hypothetical protein
MPLDNIAGSRALYVALSGFARRYGDISQRASDQITGIIMRYAGADGKIPPAREREVLAEVERVIAQVFVGPDGRNAYGRDGVTPLAPYPTLLNNVIQEALFGAIRPQSAYMQERLPDDVQAWLRRAVPHKPPAYEPPHLWVDPNGHRLSNRIWQTSLRTRIKVDSLLSEGIRAGKSARDMARQLEQFLLPGRAPIRTNKPYGSDASFDAMRLARSEITRAHSTATLAAGQDNPFVTGMDFKLSIRHPKVDICDDLATLRGDGSRIREPHPLDSVPVPVQDTHPQCICVLLPAASDDTAGIVANLRAQMQHGAAPPYTPIDADGYVSELLSSVAAGAILERVFA